MGELAQTTEGLSCRELEKLAIAVQGANLSRQDGGNLPEEWFATQLKNHAREMSGRKKATISECDGIIGEERGNEGAEGPLQRKEIIPSRIPEETSGFASRETSL